MRSPTFLGLRLYANGFLQSSSRMMTRLEVGLTQRQRNCYGVPIHWTLWSATVEFQRHDPMRCREER